MQIQSDSMEKQMWDHWRLALWDFSSLTLRVRFTFTRLAKTTLAQKKEQRKEAQRAQSLVGSRDVGVGVHAQRKANFITSVASTDTFPTHFIFKKAIR